MCFVSLSRRYGVRPHLVSTPLSCANGWCSVFSFTAHTHTHTLTQHKAIQIWWLSVAVAIFIKNISSFFFFSSLWFLHSLVRSFVYSFPLISWLIWCVHASNEYSSRFSTKRETRYTICLLLAADRNMFSFFFIIIIIIIIIIFGAGFCALSVVSIGLSVVCASRRFSLLHSSQRCSSFNKFHV